jgi:hypothetical protein
MKSLRPRLRAHLRRESHRQNTRQSSNAPERNVEARSEDAPDEGAMVRRLSQMTESALETGGKSARRAVDETPFDEKLRRRLQDRIASAIRSDPSEAPPAGERGIADARLGQRMPESHKRPSPVRMPTSTRPTRIESAIDQSTAYAALKKSGMTAEEKDQFLKDQRARFQPGARDIPATLSGLASLANERIEEAIARGQFKNLPRGKPLAVDHNSSSPFIDTTEYLMNKMIKKQDIVPPWIEKQKEVSTAARRFRSRLRSDWKRHAARVIASYGGSPSQQIRRAEEFAAAEPKPGSDPISPSGQSIDTGVFRDAAWETAEHNFHELSIKSLNSLTRSYNLMAPWTAQRPYFSLQRELKACYADVAPLIPAEIHQHAMAPKQKSLAERMPGPARLPGFSWRDVWKDMFKGS